MGRDENISLFEHENVIMSFAEVPKLVHVAVAVNLTAPCRILHLSKFSCLFACSTATKDIFFFG